MIAIRILCAAAALATLAACGKGALGGGRSLSGAGATFPASIYSKWSEDYRARTGVGLNYQAIGSGGGIKQIGVPTVDFGASDKPLTPEQLTKARLYQFPTLIGGIVPIVNVAGVTPGGLRLTGPLLARIFLGQVKRWDDAAIRAINPGIPLPRQPITVVHRSDGSGTTFLFTTYLSSQSPAWARTVGAGDAVAWPVGLASKGNDGVSAFVRQTAGAVGYVEYAYARRNGASFTQLQNRAGQFVRPGAPSFSAAAAAADWAHAPGNHVLLLDVPAAGAWPISGATFVLMRRDQDSAESGRDVLKFFDWAFTAGDAAAMKLDYVPLPQGVKALIRRQWSTRIVAQGKPIWPAHEVRIDHHGA